MAINRKPRVRRSPKWPALAKRFIKGKACAVCGRMENVIAHHKLPVHLFPTLELDEHNLIALCENRSTNHHLLFGHLHNWESYNKDVDFDTAEWAQKIAGRPKWVRR